MVTDAYGQPLDDRPLLGSGSEFQMSCVAASNASSTRDLRRVERGLAAAVVAGCARSTRLSACFRKSPSASSPSPTTPTSPAKS